MPSGFSRKLMYGVEISSLSSRIAKWCEASIGFCRPPLRAALSWPRCAISRVVLANASRPLSVNSIVTIGGPPAPFSKFCSGFLMSLPERTGLSLSTHHWSTSPRSRCSPVALVLGADDDDALGHLEDLRVGDRRLWSARLSLEVLLALGRDARRCSGALESLSKA